MKKVKHLFEVLITIVLIVTLLTYYSKLFERKDSITKNYNFISSPENFDVLFFGTSHMWNGVFPMELFNNYGISSYNLGGPLNSTPISYWLLRNSLDYTSPKLVVLDCYQISVEEKSYSKYDYLHYSSDIFPLSISKFLMAYDINDDSANPSRNLDSFFEIIWPFSTYHSRWNELTYNDFNPYHGCEFGAESQIGIAPESFPINHDSSSALETETTGTEYLRKFIEYCQNHSIEVLLVYLPFYADDLSLQEAQTVSQIALEYNINYVNFLNLEIINYATDCYDISHLNPSGARKVTDYLGKYIKATYDLPDCSNSPYFIESYSEYEKYKMDLLKKQTKLTLYLMLLAEENYNISIEVYNPEFYELKLYQELLYNLGICFSDCFDNTMAQSIDSECDVRVTLSKPNTNEIVDVTNFNLE